MADLTADQHRILSALAALRDQGRVPTSQVVAEEAGVEPGSTRAVLNTLHELGLIDESLQLTEDGEKALG